MFEKSCFILLTSQCNLKCPHCYNMLDPTKLNMEEDSLNLQNLSFLFTQLIKNGYTKILFSGGEALLRNDIFEIIKDAKNKGLRTALFTNGHTLSKDIANKLGDVGLDEIRISFNELVWIKDRKQYERIFKNQTRYLSTLLFAGVSVGYVYIVSGYNVNYTYETYERLNELGASMKIQPLYIPNNFENFNEVSASKISLKKWEHLKNLFINKHLEEKENSSSVYGKSKEIVSYINFIMKIYESGLNPSFCPTGPLLVVDSNGDFHPCLFRYDIVCGNISDKESVINIENTLNKYKNLSKARCYREECLSAFR